MSIISVRDLVSGYNRVPVIGSLSFDIDEGGSTTMIGPNGIGKTTVFKSIFGLLKPLSVTSRSQESRSSPIRQRTSLAPSPTFPAEPRPALSV